MFFFHSRIPLTFSHLAGDSISDLPCFESFQECWSDTHLLHLVLSRVVILTLWSLVWGSFAQVKCHPHLIIPRVHMTNMTYPCCWWPEAPGWTLNIRWKGTSQPGKKVMLGRCSFFPPFSKLPLRRSHYMQFAPLLESGTEWEYLSFHLLFLNWFEKRHFFSIIVVDTLEIPKSIHSLWKSNDNTSFSYQPIKCFGILINFHHSHILSKCILSRFSFWAAGFHFDVSSYLFFVPSVSDLCLDDFPSFWKRYWRIPLARFYVANCSFFFFFLV